MSERRRLCITKRACIALMLLLVAGAIVNVAVAWAIVAALPRQLVLSQSTSTEASEAVRAWLAKHGHQMQTDTRVLTWTYGSVSGRMCLLKLPGWALEIERLNPRSTLWYDSRVDEIAAGWPMYAMSGTLWKYFDAQQAQQFTFTDAISVPWRGGTDARKADIVPLRPLWPGFAINTVFYAVILWMLFAAPFALRRLRGGRRIKRGLCPKCAYPVGTWGGAVCTECGAAVVAKPQRGALTTAQGNALGIDHPTTPPPKP